MELVRRFEALVTPGYLINFNMKELLFHRPTQHPTSTDNRDWKEEKKTIQF